jgi:hypothetical protein
MKSFADRGAGPSMRRSSEWRRRLRIFFRLTIRRLLRMECVEVDAHDNPKINHIRWIV